MIRDRGGKIVIVDPRRSESTIAADEHVAIRPGTDASLLLGTCAVLIERGKGRIDLVLETADGWHEIEPRLRRIRLADVASETGV